MAYKIDLTSRVQASGSVDVPVPDQVAADLKELYEALSQGDPTIRAHAAFDTVEEKNAFILQGKTWARQNGLEFRVSPTRVNRYPKTEMLFNVQVPKPTETASA